MTDTPIEGSVPEVWSVLQCPFSITYSRRTLDDIRLAVVDAFFSLPRGGAEIGGVLLGKLEPGRVVICDYLPLECEHLFGPSFTLSPADQERLAEILSAAAAHMSDFRPVGWYHSHTRSEIFLSETDLEIHHKFFPELWQIALVLRPSTLEPTRAGFFFREPDGSIHAEGSYKEIALEPLGVVPARTAPELVSAQDNPSLEAVVEHQPANGDSVITPADAPLHQVATASAVPDPEPLSEVPVMTQLEFEMMPAPETKAGIASMEVPELMPVAETRTPAEAITAHAESAITPVSAAAPLHEAPIQQTPETLPGFLKAEPARSRRGLWTGLALAAVAASGVLGYQKRDAWVPQVNAATKNLASSSVKTAPPAPLPPPAKLSATDNQGQLQLRWDSSTAAIAQARDAVLQIDDGGTTTDIPLDSLHLNAGSFTYLRKAERVDAKLTVKLAGGQQVQSAANFLGALPAPPPPRPREDPELKKQAAELARKNTELTTLEGDLQRQNAELKKKNADLGKQKEDLSKQSVKLKADLTTQTALVKKLELQIDQIQKKQQRKRMTNQSFDPLE
jgi:hypothetical protein